MKVLIWHRGRGGDRVLATVENATNFLPRVGDEITLGKGNMFHVHRVQWDATPGINAPLAHVICKRTPVPRRGHL